MNTALSAGIWAIVLSLTAVAGAPAAADGDAVARSEARKVAEPDVAALHPLPCAPARPSLDDLKVGKAQLARGDVAGALVSLSRAVAEDPRGTEACRLLAETLRAVGRAEEAERLETHVAAVDGFCLARRRPRLAAAVSVE